MRTARRLSPKLRQIAERRREAGGGDDRVDLEDQRPASVAAGGADTEPVGGARDLFDRCVHEGVWKPKLPHPMPAFEAMKFGVLGFGRIGRLTIARARGFGFRLLACDPYLPDDGFPADVRRVALEQLLTQSDILSLHVPLTPETRRLLNAERLSLMKPTSILINTARGQIIDTKALVGALNGGGIAAAGIDVFEEEPLPVDHPLLSCPNALVTPHYAWHSCESRPKLYLMAVEEAIRGARGEPLRSCVNGIQPRSV